MTLIKSISGIRGTIGGGVGDNLTPVDAVKFAAAYGQWLKSANNAERYVVVVGRDARPSGDMIQQLVMQTLIGQGIDVIDLGLSTTPTVEMAVPMEGASGGIILTASHNPKQWNALKLLNQHGEFIDAKAGQSILSLVENEKFEFCQVDDLGRIDQNDTYIDKHIQAILALPIVDVQAIKSQNYTVVIDAVNSTGGIALPPLLEALGVNVIALHCTPNGEFPHNPEPLKEHLGDLMEAVTHHKADLGFVVDPDVDRLAIVDETGEMFGEEYTLVAVADYVLSKTPGNTVSNLSSSRALCDVTQKRGGQYVASAVGEVNVVAMMKQTKAVIGGEGNGGIIYPELHYGRDSLVGVALFLSHLAQLDLKVSALKASYPQYAMSKNKVALTPDLDVDQLMDSMAKIYKKTERVNTIDGVKIDFENSWVHLRKSNTEPIIRIYTEARDVKNAEDLAQRFVSELKQLAGI
ncbi:MAG: phosphoglucosamine mutase [Flavobacteriaceae bacterium]